MKCKLDMASRAALPLVPRHHHRHLVKCRLGMALDACAAQPLALLHRHRQAHWVNSSSTPPPPLRACRLQGRRWTHTWHTFLLTGANHRWVLAGTAVARGELRGRSRSPPIKAAVLPSSVTTACRPHTSMVLLLVHLLRVWSHYRRFRFHPHGTSPPTLPAASQRTGTSSPSLTLGPKRSSRAQPCRPCASSLSTNSASAVSTATATRSWGAAWALLMALGSFLTARSGGPTFSG
mmetsp:Transcript_75048/g.174040  ORF Transcript_75048/g.174040 Transcript_75048/m.174040 type:complete len:235 (-) Transcript_75048:624-1328(-)